MSPARLTLALDNLKRQGDRLRQAVGMLQKGQLLLVPTELGYMVAARADRSEPVEKLMSWAGESWSYPAIVLVANPGQLKELAREVPPAVSRLCSIFWPGPLVLTLWRGEKAVPALSSGMTKLSFTAPFHPLAQALVEQCGFPLAAVPARHEAPVDGRLEWREPPLELEPTVLELTAAQPRLTSLGFVSVEELTLALDGKRPVLSSDQATPHRFTRYAPAARLIVVEGDPERAARRIKFLRDTYVMTEKCALLLTQESAVQWFEGVGDVRVVGSRQDVEVLGRGLQGALREIETRGSATVVLVEGVPREGAGVELMELLTRSAHQVINTEDPGFAGQAGMQPRQRKR